MDPDQIIFVLRGRERLPWANEVNLEFNVQMKTYELRAKDLFEGSGSGQGPPGSTAGSHLQMNPDLLPGGAGEKQEQKFKQI